MSSTSSRSGADGLATLAVRGVSRRTVARTTAWATPVLLTSIGAPAFAGTGVCNDRGMAVLACTSQGDGDDGGGDGGDDGGDHHHHHDQSTSGGGGGDDNTGDNTCTVSSLTFGASTTTATVTIEATDKDGNTITKASDTGVVRTTSFSPTWDYINLHHPEGMSQGDTLTMTITLSQAVRNFTVRITDIDKDPGSWIDEVFVSPQAYGYSAGSNVTGTGATGDPFIADSNGRIDDTNHPDAGDVTLAWQGAVSQVTIRYIAGDKKNDSGIGQHIGVGQFGFDNCA